MNKCIIFTSEKELQKLTGLSHDELWDNNFNLDDWDIGFCCDKPLSSKKDWWLLQRMENWCTGYKRVFYMDKYYYMVYHS